MNYLTDKVFHTYFSGVPNGSLFSARRRPLCAPLTAVPVYS